MSVALQLDPTGRAAFACGFQFVEEKPEERPLSEIRSVVLRDGDGTFLTAWFPNSIGATPEQIIKKAEVQAAEIGGTVHIAWKEEG